MTSDEWQLALRQIGALLDRVQTERDKMGNILCEIGKSNENSGSSDYWLPASFWDWREEHKAMHSQESK